MGHRRSSRGAWLLLLPLLSAAGIQVAADERQLAKELEQIELRLSEERKGWMQFKLLAKSDEERAELIAAFPRDEFVGQLTALAARAPGTGVAAVAWLDVFNLACLLDDHALFTRAVERLLADHMASPYMGSLALELTYGTPSWAWPEARVALRKILAGTTDTTVRAYALVQLALLVGLDDTLGEEGRAEAESLLTAIETEFPTRDFLEMTGKQFATGARHEIQELRVGQVAPDFEVTDQDGVRFKLSDYRGRVVLLDFWGFV